MPLTFKSTGTRLGVKLRRLSESGARNARAALASAVRDLIAEGFAREADPRGRKWAARKDNLTHPILDLTGKMKRGFQVDTRGANIVVENHVVSDKGRPYPLFHQTGTSNMPARKPLPDASLSRHWKAEFDRVVRKSLERLK
jgi:hypothetical protein